MIVSKIHVFVVEPFYVKGVAMEPNFNDKDYLFIKKFGNDYQRGDVIIFKYSRNPQEYFIKRIIGLPGEKIQIKDGEVIMFNGDNPNGKVLTENYLTAGTKIYSLSDTPIELANDEYYVLGDNRNTSKDSRVFGAVNKNLIVGEFWLAPLKN